MTTYDYRVDYFRAERSPRPEAPAAGIPAAEVMLRDTDLMAYLDDGWEPYLTAGDGASMLVVFMRRPKGTDQVPSKERGLLYGALQAMRSSVPTIEWMLDHEDEATREAGERMAKAVYDCAIIEKEKP